MRVRCNVCAAEYDTEQRDRTLYFHQCAPLSGAELKAAIARGAVVLSAPLQADLDRARKLDAEQPRPDDEVSRVDFLLAHAGVERPGARNENIHGSRGTGKPSDPIAPGIGYTRI